jgi:hypothetical protein
MPGPTACPGRPYQPGGPRGPDPAVVAFRSIEGWSDNRAFVSVAALRQPRRPSDAAWRCAAAVQWADTQRWHPHPGTRLRAFHELVALPESLLFLHSVLLPGVGLVGETREAEQRLLPAAEDAPVAVLLVGGLPVLGDIEPDVDVARWQEDRRDDPVDHKTERQPPPTMRQSG